MQNRLVCGITALGFLSFGMTVAMAIVMAISVVLSPQPSPWILIGFVASFVTFLIASPIITRFADRGLTCERLMRLIPGPG